MGFIESKGSVGICGKHRGGKRGSTEIVAGSVNFLQLSIARNNKSMWEYNRKDGIILECLLQRNTINVR